MPDLATMPTPSRFVPRIRRGFDAAWSLIFGHDVFISYGRADAFEYATVLAERIAELGLSVSFDQLGTPAGIVVPKAVLARCRMARMLVLIGSEAACRSPAVDMELQVFPSAERPLVAIDIGGAIGSAIWQHRVPGVTRRLEAMQALLDKAPSAAVVKHVKAAASFTRRDVIQRRAVIAAVVITGGLLVAAVLLSVWINMSRSELGVVRTELEALSDERRGLQERVTALDRQIERASADLREARSKTADAELATRRELGRTASLLASQTGNEQRALEAGLGAVANGQWYEGAPPAIAVRGLTDAAAAVWYSLPVEAAGSRATAAAFTPDGSVLVAELDSGLTAWSTVSGQKVPLPTPMPDLRQRDHDRQFVLDLSGPSALLKDRATGAAVAALPGYEAREVASHAFSPGRGELVAIGTNQGSLQLWKSETGEHFTTLEGHSKEPYFEQFVPLDRPLGPHDVHKVGGKIVRHSNIGINHLAFAPDDAPFLISAANDRSAIIWDLRQSMPRATLGGHDLEVNYADFSPAGRYAVSASEDGAVHLWALNGRPITVLRYHTAAVTQVVFSEDDSRLATFDNAGTVRIWRPTRDDSARTFDDKSGPLERVSFSPDGQLVVASSQVDGFARVWDATSGQLRAKLRLVSAEKPPPDDVGAFVDALAADEQHGSEPFRYGYPVMDELGNGAATGNSKFMLDAGPRFSPDGKRLLTQSGNVVVCWDTTTWEAISRFDRHTEILSAAAFSPDGLRVVTGGNDRKAYLWLVESGALVTSLDIPGVVTSVVFSPNGKRIATSSSGAGTAVWDGQTGQPLLQVDPEVRTANSVQYGRDGEVLLVAEDGFAWRILDAATGAVRQAASGDESDLAVFSPDGRRVLTTHAMQAEIWSADTGAVLARLEGHPWQISAAAFSADGQRVATASWDETVRVWDSSTGEGIATLRGHLGRVHDVRWSPDDHHVVTASMDGTAKVFPAEFGVFLVRARAALGRP